MSIGPSSDDDTPRPPEPVRRRFWAIVLLLNAGFLAVSLGLMLAGFEARYRDGAILVAGGAAILYGAYRRYERRHEVLEADPEDGQG
ncbi:MAG: hypothetical protein ABEJ77_00380 [Halanaeroarchaeum sp.]